MVEQIAEEEIIIQDHLQNLVNTAPRKKIKNLLLISGGGVSATFLSMGAIKCLIENNLFDFDVISSVSGGTIMLHFIEQCYHKGFYKENGWFDKYIRSRLYEVIKEPIFIKLLLYGINVEGLTNLSIELFDRFFPDYKDPLDVNKLYKDTDFRYNYLDANTQHISDNHDDILNPKKDFYSDNWYFLRLLRCTAPFTNINNKPSYDAGTSDNNSFSTTFSQFEAENVYLIAAINDFIYKKYKIMNFIDTIANLIGAVTNASGKATIHLSEQLAENKNIILCKFSNNLITSNDENHKYLFSNYYDDVSQLKTYLVGVLFENSDMLKVLENEGYIQMHYALKNNKKLKLNKINFNIPNPDVYNSDVKKIYNDFKKSNLNVDIIKSLYKEFKRKFFKK